MELILEGKDCGFAWSASHLLPGHFKCSRMHGHNYVMDVKIESDKLDKNGMIVDFVEIKQKLRMLIEEFDHRLMLPSKAIMGTKTFTEDCDMKIEITSYNQDKSMFNNKFISSWKIKFLGDTNEIKTYIIPFGDVVFIDNYTHITAENLAQYFRDKIKDIYSENGIVHVTIYEDTGQGATA